MPKTATTSPSKKSRTGASGSKARRQRSRTHVPSVPWVRGVLPGFGIALTTLVVVEAVVLLGVLAGGSADLSWGPGLALGTQLWLLSLGVPLEVSVAPVSGAQPQSGVVSLAPLGLSLLTAALAFTVGSRLARRAPQGAGLAGVVLTIAVCHAAVAGIIARFVTAGVAQTHPLYALAMGGVIVILATAAGTLIGGGTPAALVGAPLVDRARKTGQDMRWAGSYFWAILRAAAVAVVAGLGVGALLLAATLVVGWQRVIAVQQQLGSDVAGDSVFFVLQLALLPNFVVWTLAWASGAGFYLGQGALVSPAGSSVETLPLVPVFGALPSHDAPTVLAVAPGLVVLCGMLAGWWFVREGENHLGEWIAIRIPWRIFSSPISIVVTGILIGAVAALVVAGLVAMAAGSLGVGRMTIVGPAVWQAAGAIGAEIAVGAALGAALSPWIEQGAAVRAPAPAKRRSPSGKKNTQKAKPSRGALERDREAQRRAAIEQKRRARRQKAKRKAAQRQAAAEKRRQRRKAARYR